MQVHQGFAKAYAEVREMLHERVQGMLQQGGIRRVVVTGHSLGGALAVLCAMDLHLAYSVMQMHLVTFGQPRVGNRRFAQHLNKLEMESHGKLFQYFRLVCERDVVPSTPKRQFLQRGLGFCHEYYKHAGVEVVIRRDGSVLTAPDYFEKFFVVGQGLTYGGMKDHALRPGYLHVLQCIMDLNEAGQDGAVPMTTGNGERYGIMRDCDDDIAAEEEESDEGEEEEEEEDIRELVNRTTARQHSYHHLSPCESHGGGSAPPGGEVVAMESRRMTVGAAPYAAPADSGMPTESLDGPDACDFDIDQRIRRRSLFGARVSGYSRRGSSAASHLTV